MTDLDVDFVRRNFPAFADPALSGWAFFENAGGSYPCRQVIDRLTAYHAMPRLQPHHPYPASQHAGHAMDEGPMRLAELLGVDVDECVVGPSTTQNTYVLAQAFRAILQPGDAIVVTDQDHEANSGCWRRLADDGIEVREWKVDASTGHLDLGRLDTLLDEAVQVVAFPHASNVVGEVNPARAICEHAHRVGAIAVVDAVAHAPHVLPDPTEMGADVLLFSTYKTYGPHQGVMVVRRDLAQRLPNQGHFFNAGHLAKRLVPAGPDHAQVAALAGIADYVRALDEHHFGDDVAPQERAARVGGLWRAHETALLEPLLAFLEGDARFRLLGTAGAVDRVPTVSVVVDRPGREVAGQLAEHKVMCAGGHFYAHRLVTAIGVDPDHGVLRFSFVHNATEAEVAQLISAVDEVL